MTLRPYAGFLIAVLVLASATAEAAALQAETAPLQIKIRKIAGSVGLSEGGFFELQMYSPDQVDLAGHVLSYYGFAGTLSSQFVFPSGVTLDGTNQRRILIASATVGGVAPDFVGALDFDFLGGAGAICFDDIDCVAWGAFSGSLPAAAGVPFPQPNSETATLERSISAGCTTLLEAADDTDDSATDFFLSDRVRHDNASAIAELACDLVFRDGFDLAVP